MYCPYARHLGPKGRDVRTVLVHRGASVKLSKPQLEVLQLLAIKPRETTKTTHHGFVAGVVVHALEKKGLAKRTLSFWHITDAGRAALPIEPVPRESKWGNDGERPQGGDDT